MKKEVKQNEQVKLLFPPSSHILIPKYKRSTKKTWLGNGEASQNAKWSARPQHLQNLIFVTFAAAATKEAAVLVPAESVIVEGVNVFPSEGAVQFTDTSSRVLPNQECPRSHVSFKLQFPSKKLRKSIRYFGQNI